MSRRRKRMPKGVKLFIFLLVAVCLVIVFKQEYRIYQIKQEKSATQQRIDQLKKQKAQLETERKNLDDSRYIEKLARENYNMVGKNEVPLFIIKEQKQAEQK